MALSQKKIDFIHLQFIVVILSFTAILGKAITLDALPLVWWRLVFALGGLFLVILIGKQKRKFTRKELLRFLLIGTVVGLHWLCFFGAIKLSNISVTLVILSSSTLFTSILEPLLLKRKIQVVQIVLSIVITVAISFIFSIETQYATGILVALLSAFLAALFTALNKKYSVGFNSTKVSFVELAGAWIILSVYALAFSDLSQLFNLGGTLNMVLLIVLGLICTSYAYTANVKVMRSLSAFSISLSINLEPIYGILLAYLFFADTEQMTPGFYIGATVVFACVLLYPLFLKTKKKKIT